MNYTSIEQSKKLLELGLSSESADMYYEVHSAYIEETPKIGYKHGLNIPCWSVGSLLEVMPPIYGLKPIIDLCCNSSRYSYIDMPIDTKSYDSVLDASYEMVCWLLENDYIKKVK